LILFLICCPQELHEPVLKENVTASISWSVRYFSLDLTELEESGGCLLLLFDSDPFVNGVFVEIFGLEVAVELDSERNESDSLLMIEYFCVS
jgi:hypothetical protein